MIVDTSKIIVFALVAAAAFGVQMYRDNMSQTNLRLNVENGLLVGLLAVMFLMVYDNISTIVEGIENTDTAESSESGANMPTGDSGATMPTSGTEATMPSADAGTSATSSMSASMATSSTTQQILNNSTLTTQTLDSPVVVNEMEKEKSNSDITSAPQPTPTDILNAPMATSPTGQPTSIPNSDVDRSKNDSSGVVSALDTQPMVANSSPVEPKVKVKVESGDPEEDDIEVDISVNGDMKALQKNVKGQLNKLVDEKNKDEGHKYVLSDPAHWVSENQYKVNILPKCQVCPVVMCDQNFMSV